MPNATRIATTTPRVGKDIMASLDPSVDAAIRARYAEVKDRGLKGADIARILMATGHITAKASATKTADAVAGLRLRTYMRSHGAWVGQGRTYGMTVAEARKVAAGFIAKVPPPAGVRYAKGQAIQAKADGATPAEVASAA